MVFLHVLQQFLSWTGISREMQTTSEDRDHVSPWERRQSFFLTKIVKILSSSRSEVGQVD